MDATLPDAGNDAAQADAGHDRQPAMADVVVAAQPRLGEAFGDPQLAINGVRGAGLDAGSLDVFSLTYEPGGESITLRWSGRRIHNGPGADFVVFENAFVVAPNVHFMDLAVVEVSLDGAVWAPLPHDFRDSNELEYSSDPATWDGFAGRTPVLLHAEDNPVDPFNLQLAGGDAFDLDDLDGSDPVAAEIKQRGFVFVRLTSAPSTINPDTGMRYPRSPVSNGADIDGVAGRYFSRDPE